MSDRARTNTVVAAYALLAMLVIPVYPHFPSPNEFSRWVVVASVIEHGTIEVSRVLPVVGSRLEDLAVVEGRTFSNKAPGLAIVSAPGYLLVRPLAGAPAAANLRLVLYAMRIFGSTIPLLLLVFVFIRAARAFEIEEAQITRAIFILIFATPVFAYGLLLFAHVLVAASLFAAWTFLYGKPEVSFGRAAAAGALIGLATISEFPSAIAGLVLLLPLLARRRFGAFGAVVAAGVPFAIALGVYQKAAFGSALTLPGEFEKAEQYRHLARVGFFGIQAPSFTTLAALLFDPSKGLLVFSPILIVSFVAFVAVWRRLRRDAAVALIAAPIAHIMVYAGYENWHGGWTVSARYIVAAIPFLGFALLFLRWSWIQSLLTGWSVLSVAVTSLVFPFVPQGFPLPWGSFAAPLLRAALIVPNALHLISTVAAIAVPLLIIAAAVGTALQRRQLSIVTMGAVLAILGGIAAARTVDPVMVLRRAYIEEVYFERAGAMQRAFPDLRRLPPQLLSRRAAELQQPPPSWKF